MINSDASSDIQRVTSFSIIISNFILFYIYYFQESKLDLQQMKNQMARARTFHEESNDSEGNSLSEDSELTEEELDFFVQKLSQRFDFADFPIDEDLIAELEKQQLIDLANKKPPIMEQHKLNIQAAIEKWRLHDKDVGSPEVQIAITTERIKYLTAHMLRNPKDHANKRGLQALVNLRRTNLNYLYSQNTSKALMMTKELNIRFTPPMTIFDRKAKYRMFKNTKRFQPKKKLDEFNESDPELKLLHQLDTENLKSYTVVLQKQKKLSKKAKRSRQLKELQLLEEKQKEKEKRFAANTAILNDKDHFSTSKQLSPYIKLKSLRDALGEPTDDILHLPISDTIKQIKECQRKIRIQDYLINNKNNVESIDNSLVPENEVIDSKSEDSLESLESIMEDQMISENSFSTTNFNYSEENEENSSSYFDEDNEDPRNPPQKNVDIII